MSDFRAIGGVSATLQTLLQDRMELPDGVSSVPVTVGPPPFTAKDNEQHTEDPRVNLFLYRVTENGYLQNQEIPGRGSPGAFGHPPLSLNLHYLVTGYGTIQVIGDNGTLLFDDTTAHFLLGSAMRVLHDVPIVTDVVTTVRPPSGSAVLHESLLDAFERVRLSLEPLTLEDITKVWTALALRYRLSAAYVVNVVQIESQRKRTFPRPVGQPASSSTPPLPTDPPAPGPWIYVMTIQTPTITEVKVIRAGDSVEQPFPYARINDTLVLRGTFLSGPVTSVAFGEVVVPASSAQPDLVLATIPDAAIFGVGAIPSALQLQPGVRTAKVVVSDPQVPHSAFVSNEAAFMLVPTVNPALLAYAAGPPRALTIGGVRLIPTTSGGEAMIGRSAVARSSYTTESPTQIVVPIPDTLPGRSVNALVGAALPDPVPLGGGAQILRITIGGTTQDVTANLPSTIARSTVAGIVAGLIHDALPTDTRFTGTRVDLWHDQLYVVPGGLFEAIAITSPTGTFAGDLGLTAAQPPGVASALISGELASPPPLSSSAPRLTLTITPRAPVILDLAKPTSLAALAEDLQTKINAASGAVEYAGALVAASASQLLVIPGSAGAVVSFDAAAGDDTTVVELQLHARFAVRVRVNGAESIDPATVELPQ
jgi:hypothetical protein